MSPPVSRRSALRLGGAGLVTGCAGCSGLLWDRGLDVFLGNDLPNAHTIWVKFTVEGQETDVFEKTLRLDPRTERKFEDAIPYPDGRRTAVVVSRLDDRPTSEPYEFPLTDRLGRFGVTAHEHEGERELYYTRKERSE